MKNVIVPLDLFDDNAKKGIYKMKINTDTVFVFTEKTLNPQHRFKPDSDFKIKDKYPNAIRAISIYHSGPDIVRIDIPVDKTIKFTPSGGDGVIIGGSSYNSLHC